MILVTGGTGLVGAHLLLQLAEGKKAIRALYRTETGKIKAKKLFEHYNKANLFDTIEWAEGDITDIPSLEAAFANVTHVYHCAGYISFDPGDEELLRKVNIEGTANVVNCALAYGVRKLCHVSSVAALGDPREDESVITEETEWNPEITHSDYAISKHGAEMEVWRARQEGLDVVIVNPGIIFGYGFWAQGSGRMFKAVNNGQYFYTKGSCGVISVEDVTTIMTELMNSDISGERYILVAGQLSYDEMLFAIADGLGKKRPAIYASRFLTSVAWRLDWLLSKLVRRKRLMTRAMAAASHNHENYDNSKIKGVLNFKFRDVKQYLKMLAETLLSSGHLQ
ncbi:NAD-dependent epimerase/dehydratase family protein [Flavobacterium salilacus subsp. salilacus]|uniref:NAD-dependent epimerase/dehydratase family protein n=1 Tax=Flavobacterium TaxID=237 RepID=UPI001074C027|nr:MULTISPECIES: NAD-dependent epimerase/dehydratase family protein [Flavobacterium]KAF2520105.1 NAD-dependent epimerase/dehydratase family protein [Flavobacterium salilacus subsp. salilacus]MBE1613979.1 NAD-dependent epimerase/dehydratase family protein [Flavobacterium sp. SaA2.13]